MTEEEKRECIAKLSYLTSTRDGEWQRVWWNPQRVRTRELVETEPSERYGKEIATGVFYAEIHSTDWPDSKPNRQPDATNDFVMIDS